MTAKVELAQYASLWRDGNEAAGDRLLCELEGDLRHIAEALLAGERNFSLSAGELVSDAIIRLSVLDRNEWKSDAHLLALASTIMRQVLFDHIGRTKSQNGGTMW